jgi:hypothetical protein
LEKCNRDGFAIKGIVSQIFVPFLPKHYSWVFNITKDFKFARISKFQIDGVRFIGLVLFTYTVLGSGMAGFFSFNQLLRTCEPAR